MNMETGIRQILDISRWQQLSFRDQITLIWAHHILYGTDRVIIEDAAAQSVWVQEVKRGKWPEDQVRRLLGKGYDVPKITNVPVTGHEASDKRSLAKGVPSLLLEVESGDWSIPWTPGGYNHHEVENFLVECEAFGWKDDKLEGVGEHDDTVMSWWHNQWGCNRAGKRRTIGGSIIN